MAFEAGFFTTSGRSDAVMNGRLVTTRIPLWFWLSQGARPDSNLRVVMGRALMLRKLQAFREKIGMGSYSPGALYLVQKYAPKALTGEL